MRNFIVVPLVGTKVHFGARDFLTGSKRTAVEPSKHREHTFAMAQRRDSGTVPDKFGRGTSTPGTPNA
jgi:hypothetical protein